MAAARAEVLVDYGVPALGALVVHAVAAALVIVTVSVQGQRAPAEQPQYIEAEVIDAQKIEEEALRLRLEAEAAARRRADEAARVAAERRAEVEAMERAAAAQRAEAERKAAAERAAADAEKARVEEARREAAAAKERETELKRQLAAEERRRKAEQAGLLDQYKTAIQQKVMRSWLKPAFVQPGLDCEVRVEQIARGEVVRVSVTACNGDETVQRSIENAVWRASPLPAPPDPSLFERVLIIQFRPEN